MTTIDNDTNGPIVDWKSLIIKILLMILTPLSVQLHLNMGAASLSAIASDLADLIVLGYGLYRSSGMRLVPHHAIVVDPMVTPANALNKSATVQTAAGPITGKIIPVLIFAFAVSAFLASAPAMAQKSLKLPIDPLHLNGSVAGQSSQPTAVLADVMSALAKPFQDLADFIAGDADGAATLATVIPNLQDVNGKACWVKMQEAGAVFKAHPVPLTLKVMTDFESIRLLQMTTNDLCSYTPCTVVFSDASNLVTGVASAVGGAMASSLQIPSLTTLCSRIPQIAPQLPAAVTGLTIPTTAAATETSSAPATPKP